MIIKKGFTLIELLVVISIIGILAAISIFGLQNSRASARDATRKSDLELIRSGIEIYRSDCNRYPASLPSAGNSLKGNGSSTSCSSSNTYISEIPADPDPTRNYRYSTNGQGSYYELCSSLENGSGTENCGGTNCGSGHTCNYKVINP